MSDLAAFVRAYPRLFVLTGAGLSTDSGIPDYRDGEGRWKRSSPVTLQEFLRADAVRRRYWARSMIGWPIMSGARPNAAHRALAQLQAAGHVRQLVTQNVDELHQRAGSVDVVELHGSIARVGCLDCGTELSRAALQGMLEAANPAHRCLSAAAAPDGDADVEPAALAEFEVPACPHCGGLLKPSVVFFGENVPRPRVDTAMRALEEADAMLVVGSSLMVYSGYRFCEHAQRLGKPIAAINLGRTRADHLLSLKVERPCAEGLGDLVAALEAQRLRAETV
ncbi:MAG: NAD-dependent protein deacetylase [Burkholderiales bacterium]